MEKYDPRIDAYIAKSADFSKPILTHFRTLVHKASPLISETIKWNCPVFEYNGILCFMRAYKQYCAFGLWKHAELDDPHQLLKTGASGSFGHIFTLHDLPGDEYLIAFIRQSVTINDASTESKK